MGNIGDFLKMLGDYSWNLPLIMLLVGTGAFFTSILWFVQARRIKHAFRIIRGDYDDPDDQGDITHFQALCAALSATIGVGNIAGVATALHMGGPGAIFWMWVTAFVGMATKYATCLLSQKYRHVHSDGSVSGGPMYYIEKGLGSRFKWLAVLFAFCAVIASFGGGNMVQSNSMTEACINYLGSPRLSENTSLGSLNDGKGIGETSGVDFLIHTRSGKTIPVDIHGARTLGDFLAKINENPKNKGQRIFCQFKNHRFFFRDRTRGKKTFQVLPQGSAFAELSIEKLRANREGIILSNPLTKPLPALNNGRGLTDLDGADLFFQLRDGSIFKVDLQGISTPESLVERINKHRENLLTRAMIHLDQKHLRFKDFTKGSNSFRLEPHSSTVSDLGVRMEGERRALLKGAEKKLTRKSPLTIFNGGEKIRQGSGSDLKIHLHNGAEIFLDLAQAKTVGDFLNLINGHPENGSTQKIMAQISGKTIVITDLTEGEEAFSFASYSSTLQDLWFTKFSAPLKRPHLIQNTAPNRMLWRILLGLLIAISVWLVIVGGIKRIGQVASKLVPAMCILYIAGALLILFRYMGEIPHAFYLIFKHAFTSTGAVEGGFMGAGVMFTLTWGVKRAVFSNEAGLGSAPIAHAAAKTKEPVREGLVAMVGPFIDTIVVCTVTALVIIVTNQWGLGETSSPLTQDSFTIGLPFWGLGGFIVALGLVLFAFSTSISWSYYGDRCVEYLFGKKAITPYRWIFCIFLFVGAVWEIEAVWAFADITMAAMAFPNLIATIALSGVVLAMTKDYFSREHLSHQELAQLKEAKAGEISNNKEEKSPGKDGKIDEGKEAKKEVKTTEVLPKKKVKKLPKSKKGDSKTGKETSKKEKKTRSKPSKKEKPKE